MIALLMLALAWAWGFAGAQQPAVQGLAHELVHLQSVAHHHDDDAQLQLDEAAPAELSHHHAGDGAKPLALGVPDWGAVGLPRSHVLASGPGPHWRSVDLPGLLRPPRTSHT